MNTLPIRSLLPAVALIAAAGLPPVCSAADGPAAVQAQFRVFPRLLLGKGAETRIVLLNPGAAPVAFQQAFFSGGKPAPLAIRSDFLVEDLTSSALQGVLMPGSSVTLTLSAPSDDVQEAWSLLTYNEGSVEGYAVVRRRAASGAFSFEAALPLGGTQDLSTYIPFDNTQGFRSQLTLVNPTSDRSAVVRLTCLDPQGRVVLMDAVTLAPAQQLTLVLPDTYPDLANKTGSILVETETDRLSVTALRQNINYGVIAALPSMTASPARR
jgi:hypothetical protein